MAGTCRTLVRIKVELIMLGRLVLYGWMLVLFMAGVWFLWGGLGVLWSSLISVIPFTPTVPFDTESFLAGIVWSLVGAWLVSGLVLLVAFGNRQSKMYCLFVSLCVVYGLGVSGLQLINEKQWAPDLLSSSSIPLNVILLFLLVIVYFVVAKGTSK